MFGETEWLTEDMVSLQLDVNLSGPINVTRLFAPLLRKYKSKLSLPFSKQFAVPSVATKCYNF